jgi:hypothetical protein
MSGSTSASRIKLFLRILEAELKDLVEDIQIVEGKHRESYDRLKITQYVFLENSALLEKEHECLKALLKRIFAMKVSDYADVDALSAAVMQEAKAFVERYEFPESVVAFVERKIRKVRRYFDEPED